MSQSSPPESAEPQPDCAQKGRWTRQDALAALFCMGVATLLAIAPHLAMLAQRGTLEYLADGDDVLYLAIARVPYHGENALRDPFARPSESSPTLYAWAQFVPLARLTRWIGLPPILMGLVWRFVGGLLLGLSFYTLFRRMLGFVRHPTAWALGLALVCLADPGLSGGRTLVQAFGLLRQVWEGAPRSTRPEGLAQYRVVTPLLNLPFLILLVASLLPVGKPSRFWTLVGILSLGLCFQLYFFFWTAALPVVGLTFLLSVLDGWRNPSRRLDSFARAKQVGLVLVGGLLIGFPQVYSNARSFADPSYAPILQRLSRGWKVEPGSALRTLYLANVWFWGKFGLATLAIWFSKVRNLGLVWWLSLSGFALVNSALVTGLEFENYHWNYVHAPFTEILILGAFAQILDRRSEQIGWPLRLLWLVPIGLVLLAGVWRPFEAIKTLEASRNSQILEDLRDIRPALESLGSDRLLAGPFETNVALLFSQSGELFQVPHTSHSTLIPDQVVHERHALNAWLQGDSLDSYAKTCAEGRFQVGPESLPQWSPESLKAARTSIFRAIESDSGKALLERYRPDTLLRPTSAGSPPSSRGGPWLLLKQGKTWTLWSRKSG